MSDFNCRILYVDDHEDSAEMLRLVLAESDYLVHPARSVQEALELASEFKFDLYVIDKSLPDGSGLELLKKLNEITPNVPSVVYTGDVYEVHRQQAMAAGADAYVCKPDLETLIQTVHSFLAERECAVAAKSA